MGLRICAVSPELSLLIYKRYEVYMNRNVQMGLRICAASPELSLIIYKRYEVYMNRNVQMKFFNVQSQQNVLCSSINGMKYRRTGRF